MAEDCRGHVFAPYPRLNALALAIEPVNLAKKKSRHIKHVDAEIEKNKMIFLGQVGLFAINIMPGAKGYPAPGQGSERSRLDDFTHFPHRPEEPHVFMHHEWNVGGLAFANDGQAFGEAWGERLLHNDGQAGGTRIN